MANQYKSALHHAAEDLAKKCAEADIDFDFEKREIYWRGITKTILPGTPKQEILITLAKMIKADKNIKEQERIKETQGALL